MDGFNSTLVRLEAITQHFGISLNLCFNSTLVRLEAFAGFVKVHQLVSFNSTLVRLEGGIVHFEFAQNIVVSIPLWFDWKSKPEAAAMVPECFNSTLVRLEAGSGCNFQRYCSVSIPLWFDWK